MRIAEPIDTSGFFWLPGDPQTLSPGVLRISQLGDVTLELMRPFGDPVSGDPRTDVDLELSWGQRWDDPERILGLVERHGYVTLEHCLRTGGILTFGGGLTKGTFRPALAFLGLGQDEAIHFQDFRFTVEGLSQWLGRSGIRNEQSYDTNTGAIHYSLPDSIVVTLAEDLDLQFDFGIEFPTVSVFDIEATVKQTSSVALHSSSPKPFEYFSAIATQVSHFLAFSMDRPLAINSFTGYVEVEREDGRVKKAIEIYGNVGPRGREGVSTRPYQPLFSNRNIADYLEVILQAWLENADESSNAFNLYFASWSEGIQYIDVRLLWMAQALESLHRASSQRTRMPAPEFSDMMARVLEAVPEEHVHLVEEKLQYANEPNLRERIGDLLQPVEGWIGDRKSRKLFINQFIQTRNYLTHYDKDSTPLRAEEPQEMLQLYEKLAGIIQLIILRRTGFDTEQIDRIVQENSNLRTRLGLGTSSD